jgi:hypothetical protein
MRAENITSIEEFNTRLGAIVPGAVFTKWITLGLINEDLSKQKRNFNNTTCVPTSKKGNYMVAASINGVIRPIYTGISVGGGETGIRNRLNNHLRPSQNDLLGRASGILAASRVLAADTQYFVSYFECYDKEVCDQLETVILRNFDFASNKAKKDKQVSRLQDLVALYDMGVLPAVVAEAGVVAEVDKGAARDEGGEPVKVKKIKVINSYYSVTCGCEKTYMVPMKIKELICSCSAKFVFS